jgi:hypothetical protein
MEKEWNDSVVKKSGIDNFTRIWHLIMIILCSSAWATGMLSYEYRHIEYSVFIFLEVDDKEIQKDEKEQVSFLIHGCIGTILFFSLCFYFAYGIHQSHFFKCFPFTRQKLRQSGNDIIALVRFKEPEYRRYQGVSGLIHFFGILVLCWFSVSGIIMQYFIEPDSCVPMRVLKLQEMHIKGKFLIPIYLGLHLGTVILYALSGNHLWKEIFQWKSCFKKNSSEQNEIEEQ